MYVRLRRDYEEKKVFCAPIDQLRSKQHTDGEGCQGNERSRAANSRISSTHGHRIDSQVWF